MRETEPDALDVAWCAGFIDGEGSMFVTIDHRQGYDAWGIQTRVDHTTEEPVRKLLATLGGFVLLRKAKTSAGKPIWRWQLQGAIQHRLALGLLLPHLTVKHRKAELMLAFCETVGVKGGVQKLPEATINRRHELRLLLKEA